MGRVSGRHRWRRYFAAGQSAAGRSVGDGAGRAHRTPERPKTSARPCRQPLECALAPNRIWFWQRAAALRAKVLAKSRRARLADSLIAQNCVDACVSLITRDRDFRAFAQAAGLQLLLGP
jgi:hypothetical protein